MGLHWSGIAVLQNMLNLLVTKDLIAWIVTEVELYYLSVLLWRWRMIINSIYYYDSESVNAISRATYGSHVWGYWV
jgi:hypothetical protein